MEKIKQETGKTKEQLSRDAFNIIELVQVACINKDGFNIIKRKLLDLGNDILRLRGE
jgi:hypothetical protein